MTDKEKIRNEVERLKEWQPIATPSLNKLLSLLDTMQEEPVSEDLSECANEIILEGTNFNKSWYAHPELAFKAGAKWQEKQDQKTIELAEDHAMLAGMEKMKEEMMAKAIDAHVNYAWSDLSFGGFDWSKTGLDMGDKCKLIIIKED